VDVVVCDRQLADDGIDWKAGVACALLALLGPRPGDRRCQPGYGAASAQYGRREEGDQRGPDTGELEGDARWTVKFGEAKPHEDGSTPLAVIGRRAIAKGQDAGPVSACTLRWQSRTNAQATLHSSAGLVNRGCELIKGCRRLSYLAPRNRFISAETRNSGGSW
jgi:hypothetical protein